MHSFEMHSNESACRKNVRLGLEQVVCCLILTIFKYSLIHSFSMVSSNTITMNRNRAGAMQSPCITPTV